jgi:hypothetical protein
MTGKAAAGVLGVSLFVVGGVVGFLFVRRNKRIGKALDAGIKQLRPLHQVMVDELVEEGVLVKKAVA